MIPLTEKTFGKRCIGPKSAGGLSKIINSLKTNWGWTALKVAPGVAGTAM
jgi:hypothetical protein